MTTDRNVPGMDPGNVLEVRDLKTYIRLRRGEVRAVDGVSFTVKKGETLGVVGESGCGKTMTGMSIMRLLPNGGYIAGGSILSNGIDLAHADMDTVRRMRANHIGMIFQDPMTSLNPTMTVGSQIAESVRLHKHVSRAAALDRAAEVLDLVGMPRPRERLDDYPHQLSGGLRQRVMIAMALACEPELVIADEPTTALDVTIQAQILRLLDDLRSRLGMAMILITHDMGVIAGRSDRVMVMYAGQIVESADTTALYTRTHHPYTEALLASIPTIDQRGTGRLYSIPGLPPDMSKPPPGCRFAARCLYATDRCRAEQPILGGADGAHRYACFHPRRLEGDPGTSGVSVEALLEAPATAFANAALAQEAGELIAGPVESTAAAVPASGWPGRPDAPTGTDRTAGPGEAARHEVILELRDVSKDFPVTAGVVLQRRIGVLQAVTEVSLSVRRGETLGLVGESGCGKTTLGRMVVALETATRGSVVFDGVDLGQLGRRRLRTFRRDLQMMFQDPYASLDPRMRVGTSIEEPLVVQAVGNRQTRKERVGQLLREVGLPANAVDRYPHEFSGGQRQRVGLARALALNPRLIVADEPVSALDVSIRSQILNLMKGLQEVHDLTYLFISHDLSVVRYLADRVAVMYLGRVMEIGSVEEIYASPAHHYTAGLLATVPVPDPTVEKAKHDVPITGELPSPIDPPSGCRFRTRCPRAEDICAQETPPLVSFGTDHEAACHFPLRAPVAVSVAGVVGRR
ncbi:MAG: ABC transporter ATP-binding protein [Acidimicrobiales bacterium]